MPPAATAVRNWPAVSPPSPSAKPVSPPTGSAKTATEGRSWTISTDNGTTVTGHLPFWAEDDPSEADIPADMLPARLIAIAHWASLGGTTLEVFDSTSGVASGPTTVLNLFSSSIVCHPYHDPDVPDELHIPYVEVQITPGCCWMTGLDPDALTTLATTLRTLAENFESEVRPQLIAARADWAAHHTTTAPLATSDAARS